MAGKIMKKTMTTLLSIMMVLAFTQVFLLIGAENVYAKTEVHLSDGQSYDISKAGKNTLITIDDATAGSSGNGTVELKGSSSYVWVHIALSQGKTVNVRLADGLSITPGSDSPYGTGGNADTLGWSRAGIYIDETKNAGGIVILNSEKNAKINIDSYQCGIYMAVPAIMKNDTKTKLVFDTEDKDNPGTIKAESTTKYGSYGGVGIGAFGHGVLGIPTSSYTVGNIDFHAGNIEAIGRVDGAGIGAYDYSSVGSISFSGAHVVAKAGNWWSNVNGSSGAPGIGCSYRGRVDEIDISGGYVEAWGFGVRNDSKGRPLKYLPEKCGPGIGIGLLCSMGKIEISGGTVVARGGSANSDKSTMSGCGIGTQLGHQNDVTNSYGDEIKITGGDITAVGGDYTCGIGGCVKAINIEPATPDTQLKINAYIDDKRGEAPLHMAGSGIGIGGNVTNSRYSEYPGNITIKGGDITASAGTLGSRGYYSDGDIFLGAGIGPTRYGRVNTITITGGKIQANGGWSSPGIGGDSDSSGNHGTVERIHITGGTITATKACEHKDGAALSGIGGCKTDKNNRTEIIITGGSIIANGSDYDIGYDAAGQPKNEAGETVYGTKFHFDPDIGEWTPVKSFELDPELSYDYGLADVYSKKGLDGDSNDNIVEFWIPKRSDSAKYKCKVSVEGRKYGYFDDELKPAGIDAGDSKTLKAYTDITYVNSVNSNKYKGVGVYGSDRLIIDPVPVKMPDFELYDLQGYSDGEGKPMVVNGTFGQEYPSPLVASSKYVDKDAKWNAVNTDLTLYMMLDQTDYIVTYDKNKPNNASHDVEGEMADSKFSVSGSSALSENGYSLAGWTFTGWNTAADGSGDDYGDKASISFNSGWGDHVTLYAQWEPKTYKITFSSGDARIAPDHVQTGLKYDTKCALDSIASIGWSYEGHDFHGWTGLEFGSFYEDGKEVINLCTLDASGDPEDSSLTAEWVGNGTIKVTTTLDGKPVDVGGTMKISLIESSSSAEKNLASFETGHYTAELGGMPDGKYQLSIDGSSEYAIPQDKQDLGQLTESSAVSVVVNYYTVAMHEDDHIASANVRETGTDDPHESIRVTYGQEVLIGASADPGYHFDGYSYYGVEPEWQGDGSSANRTIKVKGKVDITAHAAANVYSVSFNKNKPAGASHDVEGSMDDQDFVYDEPQKIWENKYSLTGWTFKGWNTAADGSGQTFGDEDLMKAEKWNLAGPPDSGAVTLYAQWEANRYIVNFSAADATSGTMEAQEFTYDTAQALKKNAFERTDWEFTGWNTEPAGTGKSFADEESVVNLLTSGSITLYAQWVHDSYTVKFDGNDEAASGSMPDENVWTHSGFELPICYFHKRGWHFTGWNTAADGSGTSYDEGAVITDAAGKGETFTLYAQWEPNKYSVKFDANTGKGTMDDQKFTYGEEQALAPCGFTKEHYVFKGWNSMQDGSGASLKDRETVSDLTADMGGVYILYAQWEKEKHTIRYDLNGGKLNGKTGTVEIVCSYGDKIKLPKPVREGYTFSYWKGSRYKAGASYTVSEDHTFTAQWKKAGTGGADTGDDNDLTFWLLMLMAGGTGLAAVLVFRRVLR